MRRKQQRCSRDGIFDAEIIVLCVRWYLRFRSGSAIWKKCWPRGILASITSRSGAGFSDIHGTEPSLPSGNPQDQRFVACDETHVRITSTWSYSYRAVDSTGSLGKLPWWVTCSAHSRGVKSIREPQTEVPYIQVCNTSRQRIWLRAQCKHCAPVQVRTVSPLIY